MDKRAGVVGALSGGASVAVAGLPQIIALGALAATPLGHTALASGVVAAFVATTFGRLCASVVSRAPGEISTPLASISIIYASLCADLMLRGGPQLAVGEIIAALSLAVVLMGVLQVLAGWIRLGEALKFLPYQVNAGFLTGTGLLVVWSQLGPMIGLEGRLTHYNWAEVVDGFKPYAMLIGIVSAAAVWLGPKLMRSVPPLLIGLLVGTVAFSLLSLVTAPEASGPTFGTVTPLALGSARLVDVWAHLNPAWLIDTALRVLPYAGLLALEGALELAITSRDVAAITGARPNINRGLLGQGSANILCGLLGGLPVAPSHSQSLAAARMEKVRSFVPGVSAVVLLVGVLAFAELLAYFPTAVLAGLLVTVGIGMIDRWTQGLVGRAVRGGDAQSEIRWNLAIVCAVAGAFFFGGVPLALLVGTILAMVVLTRSVAAATTFISEEGRHFSSTRIWPTAQAEWLAKARNAIRVLRPHGGLFFGTAEQLAVQLAKLNRPVRYSVIDCSHLTVLDATGCRIVADSARKLAERGITTLMAGLNPSDPRDRALVALGLNAPAAERHWFRDLDHALESIETELLHDHWPEVAADQPVALDANDLARGLSGPELDVLQSCLEVAEFEAGKVLFERGDASTALYVIERGLVEIHVGSEVAGRSAHRLAVFGPGCIFGEIAMLTGGARSASAVCVKPARLYVLRRDPLLELQQRHPVIHGKIIANLSLHLATRVVATTEIVRGG